MLSYFWVDAHAISQGDLFIICLLFIYTLSHLLSEFIFPISVIYFISFLPLITNCLFPLPLVSQPLFSFPFWFYPKRSAMQYHREQRQ